MPGPNRMQIRNEVVDEMIEYDQIKISRNEARSLFDHYIHILNNSINNQKLERDDTDDALREIIGDSYENTGIRDSISVSINRKDALWGSASLAGSIGNDHHILLGVAVLLSLKAIITRNTKPIKPIQALTYGVGWESTDKGKECMYKSDLIEKVIDVSHEVKAVTNVSRSDIKKTIYELRQMNCIDVDEADGRVLIWFQQQFDVEYSVLN